MMPESILEIIKRCLVGLDYLEDQGAAVNVMRRDLSTVADRLEEREKTTTVWVRLRDPAEEVVKLPAAIEKEIAAEIQKQRRRAIALFLAQGVPMDWDSSLTVNL